MRRLFPSSRTASALTATVALITLSACAAPMEPAQSVGSAVSTDRCTANKAAGKVTYLTGYQYQASASILEVIAAEKLGYFNDLCLDVEIQPGTGDTSSGAKLLAANKIQVSSVSQQELLMAADNGIDIVGISSYSNAGLEVLMTKPEVTDLKQLDGTVLGHKGNLPASVASMLDKAGADVGSLDQVKVGYDPSVLTRGQVSSLTGFISNEPNLLKASGEQVKLWRPFDYHVPGSIGAMAVSPSFASEHPTAVEDFLRGSLHAFDYCSKNAEECVGYAAELGGASYDVGHNASVWTTEVNIIQETKAAGMNLGGIDAENVKELNQMLTEYGLVKSPLSKDDAGARFNTGYVASLYQDGHLIWPAP